MPTKKYQRFYLVATPNGASYVKVESESIFSQEEGIEFLKKKHNTPDVKPIAKNKAVILGLIK